MHLTEYFKELLVSQKTSVSKHTIKNYTSDLRHFLAWFEKTNKRSFSFNDFGLETIQAFIQSSTASPATKERQLASLKKFHSLLTKQGIRVVPTKAVADSKPDQDWKIDGFKRALFLEKASSVTVKNYVSDITSFQKWVQASYPDTTVESLTDSQIHAYQDAMIHVLGLSPKTVSRKLSSIRKFGEFTQARTKHDHKAYPVIKTPLFSPHVLDKESLPLDGKDFSSLTAFSVLPKKPSRLAPFRLIDHVLAPYSQLEEHLAFHLIRLKKRIRIPFSLNLTPSFKRCMSKYINLYKKNSKFRFASISACFLLISLLGMSAYLTWYYTPQLQKDILGITNGSSRVLSYSGTLTNKNNQPVTTPTQMSFKLYEDKETETAVWSEVQTVVPESNGNFTVQLGSKTTLPARVLLDSLDMYLGVRIGDGEELRPRQQVATVGLALNSKAVQGMIPITMSNQTQNVLLALDSSGNLSIGGSANPIFQATGGDFTLSAQNLILTTVSGSRGSVIIRPDTEGFIDTQGAIVNSKESSASESGHVLFADNVSIATESAESLLTINNVSEIGSILTLMSQNIARLTVDARGQVGIGTTSPSQLVHIASSTSPTIRLENLVSGNTLDFASLASSGVIGTTSPFDLGFKTNNLVRMTINSQGFVGIGTATPHALLDVAGSASISGNLTIEGFGRSIQSANNTNLIIGGNTTGNLLLKPLNGSGYVGISTDNPTYRLDVLATEASRAATQIYNASTTDDADGLNIRLGTRSLATATTNHFLNFETDAQGVIGAITGNGSNGVTYSTNGVADFAEYLKKDASEEISFGSVVCITSAGTVTRCNSQNRASVGVASERPAFLGGENFGNRSIAVGLVGQIDTAVSNSHGEIQAGDPLTNSDIPGVAIKATQPGSIIGRALENSSGKSRIRALIQPAWYDPSASFTATGAVTTISPAISGENTYAEVLTNLKQVQAQVMRENVIVKNLFSAAQATIGSIKSGLLETEHAIVSGTLVAKRIVVEQLSLTSSSVLIDGKPLPEYIASLFPANDFSAPQVRAENLETNFITPLAENQDVAVKFTENGISIGKRASESATVTIDTQGNASFSGTLSSNTASVAGTIIAQEGNFNSASISGVLSADTIQAKTIAGLDEKVESIASDYIQKKQNSLTPAQSTTPNFSSSNWSPGEISFQHMASVSADFAYFRENLLSIGTTTLREASVLDSLSIGSNFILGPGTLDSIGADLELQPLQQGGVSFLAGKVRINTNGDLFVGGTSEFAKDVMVKGNFFSSIISPLPDSDLDILLPQKQNGEHSKLIVKNASKMPVFSINGNGDVYSSGSAQLVGDLIASGSAYLGKLNIFSQKAEAASEGSLTASSSAGTAVLPANKREITIQSPYVSGTSLIYVTPSTPTQNQVLYLLRQSNTGSFTVGVASPISTPIEFNWIVVN